MLNRLIDHYRGAVGDVVVHPPDVVVVHPQAAVADGEADPGVVVPVGVHGPVLQAGVEGIARGAVEADDGPAVVGAIVPGRLLIGGGKDPADGGRGVGARAAQAGADELPVALGALKNIHPLIGQIYPDQIFAGALVAFEVDLGGLDLRGVVVVQGPSQGAVSYTHPEPTRRS